jgi:hypothetical protein
MPSRNDIGGEKMKFEIDNICMVKWGISYFEVRVKKDNRLWFIKIPLSYLRKNNITKTLRGYKKLRVWLESEEGQEYLSQQWSDKHGNTWAKNYIKGE